MAFALPLLKTAVWIVLIAGLAGIAMGLWTSARDARNTQAVWDALLSQREPTPATFDPAMVADLPEIGQRYFAIVCNPSAAGRWPITPIRASPSPPQWRSVISTALPCTHRSFARGPPGLSTDTAVRSTQPHVHRELIHDLSLELPAVRGSVPGSAEETYMRAIPAGLGGEAFGLADPAAGRAMTETAVSRVGSISKSITAWGVMQLEVEGDIALDDNIWDHVTSWTSPPAGRRNRVLRAPAVSIGRLQALGGSIKRSSFAH